MRHLFVLGFLFIFSHCLISAAGDDDKILIKAIEKIQTIFLNIINERCDPGADSSVLEGPFRSLMISEEGLILKTYELTGEELSLENGTYKQEMLTELLTPFGKFIFKPKQAASKKAADNNKTAEKHLSFILCHKFLTHESLTFVKGMDINNVNDNNSKASNKETYTKLDDDQPTTSSSPKDSTKINLYRIWRVEELELLVPAPGHLRHTAYDQTKSQERKARYEKVSISG